MRKNFIQVVLAGVAVLALGSNVALGCACNKNKLNNTDETSFAYPAAVNWVASVEDAQKYAKAQNKPYAIYFSSKEEAKIIGESDTVIKEYAAANGNSLPTTVFELPKIIKQLREMGVENFAKVAYTKETRTLANSLDASTYTLVILAPDGTKIDAGTIAGNNVAVFMSSVKDKVQAWQAAHKVAQTETSSAK